MSCAVSSWSWFLNYCWWSWIPSRRHSPWVKVSCLQDLPMNFSSAVAFFLQCILLPMESHPRWSWSSSRKWSGRWRSCWRGLRGPTILTGWRRSERHSQVCILPESLGGLVFDCQIWDPSSHFDTAPVWQSEGITIGKTDECIRC